MHSISRAEGSVRRIYSQAGRRKSVLRSYDRHCRERQVTVFGIGRSRDHPAEIVSRSHVKTSDSFLEESSRLASVRFLTVINSCKKKKNKINTINFTATALVAAAAAAVAAVTLPCPPAPGTIYGSDGCYSARERQHPFALLLALCAAPPSPRRRQGKRISRLLCQWSRR